MSRWLAGAMVVVGLLAGSMGCSSGSDGGKDSRAETDPGQGVDSGTDLGGGDGRGNGPGVDGVTSATPGVRSARLTTSHEGWGRADCASCHETNHNSGYRPENCGLCHGHNGAPGLDPVSHNLGNQCAACHPGKHAGLEFRIPDSCAMCHVWKTAAGDECGSTETYDVVVVGGGGGGLAAAARLAKAGKRVVLLEMNYKVGGQMVNFHRGDYRFEASLHGFDGLKEGAGMNVGLFKQLGIWDRLQIVDLDPMYRVSYPDFTWDIPADVQEYEAFLKEQFPHEAAGIGTLFAEMKNLNRMLVELTAVRETGAPPNLTTEDFLVLQRYMGATLLEVVREHIQDEKLTAVWTVLAGFAGSEPSKVSAIFFAAMWNSYSHGGFHYFIGGSQAVSDALAQVIVQHGGVIRTRSLVTKIVIDTGTGLASQVRTEDGACFNAQYVISNANLPDTVNKLVGREWFPADYLEIIDTWTLGLSTVVIYLGVNRDYRSHFGDAHEIMVADSYDTSGPFKTLWDCDGEKSSFALANYSTVDPGCAPPGKNVIAITTLLAYECNDEWQFHKSHSAYRSYKEQVANAVIRRAEEYLPDLSKHIEVMEVSTPHTIRAYTLNPKGTIFGWGNAPEQATQNRPPQQTPVKNLYLAGAWTFPGGGQSAVLMSGNMAAGAVLKELELPSR